MLGVYAFHQCNGPGESGDIALYDEVDHLCG